MYRAATTTIPIESLEDPFHVSVLQTLKERRTMFVHSADLAPSAVLSIGHYRKNDILYGRYSFIPASTYTEIIHRSMFASVTRFDKMMLVIGVVSAVVATWYQYL